MITKTIVKTTTTTTTTTTNSEDSNKERAEDFIVRDYVSTNGRTFQIGYPKSAGYTEENLDTLIEAVKLNNQVEDLEWISVDWVYPSVHNPTSYPVSNRGISRAELSTGIGYDYKLDFWNTKGWYFDFKDATGDVYRCHTVRNGHHFFQYGSDDPTIVGVR